MAKEENLQPPRNGFTRDEASKGGKISGEKRKLRAAVERQLEMRVPARGLKGVQKMLRDMGIEEDYRFYSEAIAAAMIKKAIMGDVQAAIWVRDTVGEKPKDKSEVDLGKNTMDAIADLSLEQKIAMIEELRNIKPGGSE